MPPQMGRFVDTKYSTGAWTKAKPDPWLSGINEFYFTWVLPASVQYHIYLGRERDLKFRRPLGQIYFLTNSKFNFMATQNWEICRFI